MKRYLFVSSVFLATIFSSVAHTVVIELDLDATHTRPTRRTSDRERHAGWFDLELGDFPCVYDSDQHKISIAWITKEYLQSERQWIDLKEENGNLTFILFFDVTDADEASSWYYTYEISLPVAVFSGSSLDSAPSSSSSSSEAVEGEVFKFSPIFIQCREPGVPSTLKTIYDAKKNE